MTEETTMIREDSRVVPNEKGIAFLGFSGGIEVRHDGRVVVLYTGGDSRRWYDGGDRPIVLGTVPMDAKKAAMDIRKFLPATEAVRARALSTMTGDDGR